MNVDAELLYVSALLHDLGLITEFDNHTLPFEVGGGHVAAAFAAGAGWPAARRHRVAGVIIAHMAKAVDPDADPEGFLLEAATAFDISGRAPEDFPDELQSEVLERYPRLDLATEFLACFEEQARRKPDSTAAEAVGNGIGGRLAANPLERLPSVSRRGEGCGSRLCLGGSGLRLIRRADDGMEVGRAGFQSRTRVPSRARR
jgi:hypothetical protein